MVSKEEEEETLTELTKFSEDLDDIQLRPNQVCNCDDLGLDPNKKWN